MSTRYITRQGDTIDLICNKQYGKTSGVVEIVIEANRGIEDQPEVLPPGVEILLPDIPVSVSSTAGTVRLWD